MGGMTLECQPFPGSVGGAIRQTRFEDSATVLELPSETASLRLLLEHTLREDLNKTASRVMGVLRPLKVVITNYPEDQEEELDAINNPEDPSAGTRKVPFAREIYIERGDFMEDPPRKFFREADCSGSQEFEQKDSRVESDRRRQQD